MMRALVLSGGGSFGAFQLGVLRALIERDEPEYDLYCGVSVGALNCALLAQHRNLRSGVQRLKMLWSGIDTDSIYRSWFPFGRLSALWKTGLYNTAPLQELIRENYEEAAYQASGKMLRVGGVSVRDYSYRVWNEKSPDLELGIYGSAAFPILFPAVMVSGDQVLDGGLRNQTPLAEAINAGADEIDLILTFPRKAEYPRQPVAKRLFDIIPRGLQIMIDEIARTDLICAELHNKLAESGDHDKKFIRFRYFEPDEPLPFDAMDFCPANVAAMDSLGYESVTKRGGK